MNMRRSLQASAATLCLSALVAGCGQSVDGSSTIDTKNVSAASPESPGPRVLHEKWPEKVPSRGLAKGLALPLEAFMTSYADEIAVQEARDVAETACMRRYGFTDWRTEDLGVAPPVSDNASNMPRRYGLSILAEAKEYGYHVPSTGTESTPPPEQEAAGAATVLRGADGSQKVMSFKGSALPEGGCTGEVNRKIGTLESHVVEELSSESFLQSQQEPAVKTAMAAWSGCMKDRGYDTPTVWDTDELVGVQSQTPTDKEIAIAVADVECKQETDLIKIWFDQESAIQRQLIKKNQASLSGARQKAEKTLDVASGVTASLR
ncbi:hypothetical protein [Streptomyces sp. IBSBF 3010]|uniref:hypothetical protein n=1 Tax=Streptomyces sp. IBSBF 3010 TaxID=2903526 RepID=UPI002FDC2349